MTVITILTKQLTPKETRNSNAPKLDFEAILLILVSFWFNVGPFWHPVGSMLVAFGTFADLF